jgi:uncharacterized protein (TIGR03083 family)
MSVTEIPELRIELAPAAEAVERAGRKLADLLSAAEEPERDVHGLEWTLHELVAHLAGRSGRFAAYLSGTAVPEGEIAGIAEENRRDVLERSGRPVADLVEELRSNVSSFVATTHGKLGADPFPWNSGVTLDVSTASGLLLAELLVHGFDAARTLDRPWPISSADARTIIRASAMLAPWYVDPHATRGDKTTYRIAVRGGPAFRVRIDDGTASIEPTEGEADCTIRAEPSALVLVLYGRISQWRGVARARFVATGRRPWRALRFARSFLPP